MEQASSSFIKALEAMGPFAVVVVGIAGVLLWQSLKLYQTERDENRRTSDARIADGLAAQTVIRAAETAMNASSARLEALETRIAALEATIQTHTLELARKGGS